MTERDEFAGSVEQTDEAKEAARAAAEVLGEVEVEAEPAPAELAPVDEAREKEFDVIGDEPAAFSGGRFQPMDAAVSALIGSRVLPDEWDEEEALDAASQYPWSPGVEQDGAELDGDEGETVVALEEDESVNVEAKAPEEPLVEDVVYELAVAAASTGRDFDGPLLAEYLEQGGAVDDVRLTIAIGVLRLGQKLTGDRLLGVLESLGFGGEAAAARVARDELGKIPDVPVEVMTALPSSLEGS